MLDLLQQRRPSKGILIKELVHGQAYRRKDSVQFRHFVHVSKHQRYDHSQSVNNTSDKTLGMSAKINDCSNYHHQGFYDIIYHILQSQLFSNVDAIAIDDNHE